MKHTPGPWGATGRSRDEQKTIPLRSIYCERFGYSVAFVSDDRNGEPEANARLIAAAPELLAALRDVLKRSRPNGNDMTLQRISAIATAAIAKATGSAP